MKKTILLLTVLALLSVLLFSCDKEEQQNEFADAEGDFFTVEIDSVFYAATDVSGILTDGVLTITATNKDTLRPYFIFELQDLDEGVYFFNNANLIAAQYYPGFGLNQLLYGTSGNIIIVEHNQDSKYIAIEFYISFVSPSGSNIEVDTKEGYLEVTYD